MPKRKEKQPQVKDVKRFRADADIGLDDHGIAADLIDKPERVLAGRHLALTGRRDPGGLIKLLHQAVKLRLNLKA